MIGVSADKQFGANRDGLPSQVLVYFLFDSGQWSVFNKIAFVSASAASPDATRVLVLHTSVASPG